jgi:hypothetical protein
MAKPSRAVSVESLLEQRAELARIQAQAFTDKFFTAAIKATEKLLEIDREIDRLRDVASMSAARGELARVRLLLAGAIRDGSWIAAEKLSRQYAILILQEREQLEQEKLKKAGAVSDSVLVSDLVLIIRGLPSELRRQIEEALAGREVAPAEPEEEDS